ISEREMSVLEIAAALRAAFPREARRAPRVELPNWVVRLLGLFDPQIASNSAELANIRRVDGSSGRQLLAHPMIPAPDATVATAHSLIDQHLVA
ncbi:MAG: hypothetical protein JWQ89_2857, partial [Devosia sp.]|nr:hypothetical protein [Devosia sp.]